MTKTPAHILERKKAYYRRNRDQRIAYQKAYNDGERGRTFTHQFVRLLANARNRCARKGGLPMELTMDWCMNRLASVGCKCEKTRRQFTEFPKPRDPWRVSLDRIDNSKGYIPGNVQLVCAIYNVAKNVYTDDILMDFCRDFIGSSSN